MIRDHEWKMASKDDSDRANRAGEALFEVARSHEMESHGGQPCIGSRASIIAMVAHAFGIGTTPESVLLFIEALQKYESDQSLHVDEAKN
jgi:hypothetical protein